MKKLIIWDFDGVISNTEPLWVGVWREYINEKHGLSWDMMKAFETFAGINIKTKMERLAKIGINLTLEEFNQEILPELNAKMPLMTLTDDVEEILKDTRFRQCLATGGEFEKTLKKLNILGITKYFSPDNVFCSEMVEHGKPEPDIFLFAANKMNEKPENCIIIEDSYAGLMAAKRANIDVIAFIEHEHNKPEFIKKIKDLGITMIAENMTEVKEMLETF